MLWEIVHSQTYFSWGQMPTHTLSDFRLVYESTPVSAVSIVFSILWLMHHVPHFMYVRGVDTAAEHNFIASQERAS